LSLYGTVEIDEIRSVLDVDLGTATLQAIIDSFNLNFDTLASQQEVVVSNLVNSSLCVTSLSIGSLAHSRAHDMVFQQIVSYLIEKYGAKYKESEVMP